VKLLISFCILIAAFIGLFALVLTYLDLVSESIEDGEGRSECRGESVGNVNETLAFSVINSIWSELTKKLQTVIKRLFAFFGLFLFEFCGSMAKLVSRKYYGTEYIPQPKFRKTRIKDGQETRRLFEKIARQLIDENFSNVKYELEQFCREIAKKSSNETEQNILNIESDIISRMNQIDSKITGISDKINDVQNESNKQYSRITEELVSFSKNVTTGLENERSKRLTLIKKIQLKEEQEAKTNLKLISDTKAETSQQLSAIGEELSSHSKELGRLRENVDEMCLNFQQF
jgi:hypothetical protein